MLALGSLAANGATRRGYYLNVVVRRTAPSHECTRLPFRFLGTSSIAAALGEMADNAVLHANAAVGVLVGYQVIDGAAVCCVADVGDGVLKSLKTHEAYRHVQSHKEALRLALRKGVSRFGPGQGGLGFYNVFKALAAMSGTLRVYSHRPEPSRNRSARSPGASPMTSPRTHRSRNFCENNGGTR